MDFLKNLTFLLGSVLTLILGIITFKPSREKTKAETLKLLAEARKLTAEARKIEAEEEKIREESKRLKYMNDKENT